MVAKVDCESHCRDRSLCNASRNPRPQAPGIAFDRRWHGSCDQLDGEEQNCMDLFYLGLIVGFFALSWAFIVACERLS